MGADSMGVVVVLPAHAKSEPQYARVMCELNIEDEQPVL